MCRPIHSRFTRRYCGRSVSIFGDGASSRYFNFSFFCWLGSETKSRVPDVCFLMRPAGPKDREKPTPCAHPSSVVMMCDVHDTDAVMIVSEAKIPTILPRAHHLIALHPSVLLFRKIIFAASRGKRLGRTNWTSIWDTGRTQLFGLSNRRTTKLSK